MIYLNIQGGLGNQLYQAGFGLLIEHLTGHEAGFLSHSYKNYSYGFQYELDDHFPYLKNREAVVDVVPDNTVLVREHDEHFNLAINIETVLQLARSHENLLLDGYWSDERHWEPYKHFYHQVLMPQPSDPVIIQLGEQIKSLNCIGIHVRRHEYGHLGVAKMDYYRNALKQIRRERGPLPALVFTDEYNVCTFEFQGVPGVEIIRGDMNNPVRDFFALTQCKHFIASNSTFSNLAAILGETEDSIVYYPYPICVFHNNTLTEQREKRWRIIEGAVRRP